MRALAAIVGQTPEQVGEVGVCGVGLEPDRVVAEFSEVAFVALELHRVRGVVLVEFGHGGLVLSGIGGVGWCRRACGRSLLYDPRRGVVRRSAARQVRHRCGRRALVVDGHATRHVRSAGGRWGRVTQRVADVGELLGERLQLLDAVEHFEPLRVDDLRDLVVGLGAVDTTPDREQIADLFEREPDPLGMRHEHDTGERVVVVARGSRCRCVTGRQEADSLVVPDRRGGHTGVVGQFRDLHD